MERKAREKLAEDIKADIDDAINPGRMTKEEAMEFIDDLIGDLQMRLDAMREDGC